LSLSNENMSGRLEHPSILFDMISIYYAITNP
jgi:hypothetical protein